jgi:hypothetical protein
VYEAGRHPAVWQLLFFFCGAFGGMCGMLTRRFG